MERLCFVINLFPGKEAEYDKRHDEIWPELTAAINEAGFRNYNIFRRDNHVIGVAECHPDVDTALAKIGATDVNTRWGEFFSDVISSMTDDSGDLIRYKQVWRLDETGHESL